jgi:membrane-bound serine protease (ClpP class)
MTTDRLLPRTFSLSILLIFLGMALLVVSTFDAAAQGRSVRVIEVDGTITPVMANYIERGIRNAERAGDDAVILRMNTPGGLTSSTDRIIGSILSSNVPVIVYVAPQGARAGSAGVYITYAAHIAAMAPSTNIGSATPVTMGGDDGMSEDMERKVKEDAVARIRELADLRGRNADWAEDAVREAANIGSRAALEQNVIDVIADDIPSLLQAIDGRTVEVNNVERELALAGATIVDDGMTMSEQFFQMISDPSIAYILLSLGMLGIFLELANPGAVVPGVTGGIFVLLALFSLGSLNVNWAGVLLIAFGFILFAADLFLGGSGGLTIGGLIAFALGSFMLMGSTENPAFQIHWGLILSMTALLGLLFLLIAGSVWRSYFRPAKTGREGLVGLSGTVRSDLDPDGTVFVAGEIWQATSADGPIPRGTRVQVVAVDGLHLRVAPVESPQALEPA